MDAIHEHQLRYWRRQYYAKSHGLKPASPWDLPDEAELTYAERVVQVPRNEPQTPTRAIAHCGAWHALTVPFTCPDCGETCFMGGDAA